MLENERDSIEIRGGSNVNNVRKRTSSSRTGTSRTNSCSSMNRHPPVSRCWNWTTSVIIVAFMCVSVLVQVECAEFKPLKCYRCISMECKTSPEICALAKSFVQSEVERHYYTDGYPLPDCPDPSNLEEWAVLETKAPSNIACGEFATGQATCVLGRFQVNSLVVETETNQTIYGNVMGCANKRLLEAVRATTLVKERRYDDITTTIYGCHSDYSESGVRNSLKHYLRLEHCAQIASMCYQNNYCILPALTGVRDFTTNRYNELNAPGIGLFTIFIVAAAVIGILVAIMTFAGIKYS